MIKKYRNTWIATELDPPEERLINRNLDMGDA